MLSLNLELKGLRVILIGAGQVGMRKLGYALDSGATILVVEPMPGPALLELAQNGRISLFREFAPELLEGVTLAFVATPKEAAQGLLRELRGKVPLINMATGGGNFDLPAIVEDGPLRLTVSTCGAFPALTAKIAKDLRSQFKGFGDYIKVLARLRELVLKSALPEEETKEILFRLVESHELYELLAKGAHSEAMGLIQSTLLPRELFGDFDPFT
ncbi:MAG: hypothetical protein LBE38_05015 [Deltaproteobacteria bacterium]|jgi:siroheme synthase-like protein|nr:hypothetical protein [Deltaproteobacteria bacterium]